VTGECGARAVPPKTRNFIGPLRRLSGWRKHPSSRAKAFLISNVSAEPDVLGILLTPLSRKVRTNRLISVNFGTDHEPPLIESPEASIFMFAMLRSTGVFILCAVGWIVGPPALRSQTARAPELPSIRNVQVLRGGNQVEIQIESSVPVVPQTNELGDPNRLLVDFVNARPAAELRGREVNRPEVKDLRVGLFSKDPPVTRIVVDLNGPQPYQVFPSGRITIVKIGGTGAEIAGAQPSSGNVQAANEAAANVPPEPPKPSLEVAFQNGLLRIDSDRASLSEVLFAVHQRTGAEIAIPAGAEQDKVVVNLGPAPASEVLSQLLNGSKFNFVILSSPKNPGGLDQVILTPRTDAPVQAQAVAPQPPQPPANDVNDSDDEPEPRGRMRGRPQMPPFREAPTEAQPEPSSNDPQQ